MTEIKHGLVLMPRIVAYSLLCFEGFLALPRAIPENSGLWLCVVAILCAGTWE